MGEHQLSPRDLERLRIALAPDFEAQEANLRAAFSEQLESALATAKADTTHTMETAIVDLKDELGRERAVAEEARVRERTSLDARLDRIELSIERAIERACLKFSGVDGASSRVAPPTAAAGATADASYIAQTPALPQTFHPATCSQPYSTFNS